MSKVDGVASAHVNFATERLHVEYGDDVTIEEIKSAVQQAGYDVAEEDAGIQQVTILSGMTCAACCWVGAPCEA